eukprot:sb/3462355/
MQMPPPSRMLNRLPITYNKTSTTTPPPAPTTPPTPIAAPLASTPSMSEQEALESCVQLLSNGGEGTLTKESISEVFQIINNLAGLSPAASSAGDQMDTKPIIGDHNMTSSSELQTTAADQSLLESIQNTLNGLDSGDMITDQASSAITLTPEMLRLATELASTATASPVVEPITPPVKPFSLADKQLRCTKCEYLTFSKRAFTLHLRSHEEDGYRDLALQLEDTVLHSRGAVNPSDKLGRLFSSCLLSINDVTNFFKQRDATSKSDVEPITNTPEQEITYNKTSTTTPPPAPTTPPTPIAAPLASTPSMSEQEALESCVQLLSNGGEGTLTKESISEVFQIINNLAGLSPAASSAGDQMDTKPIIGDHNMTSSSELQTTAADQSLLESIQNTLNGLDSGDMITDQASSAITLTPEMLRLATELASTATASPVVEPITPPVKPFSLADKQLRCTKCEYLTFSKRAFTLHLRSHEEGGDGGDDKMERAVKHNYSGNKLVIATISRLNLFGNLKKHIEFRHANTEENMHCCTLCHFKTSSKMTLSSHISQCHKDVENREGEMEKRYQCKHCDFRCVWVGSLRSHMFDKHPDMMERNGRTDPPEHKCPLCNYSSQWRGNLKTHMLRKHNAPQPVEGFFHCKRCQFKCSSNDELTLHYESHLTDDRPFQCPLCDYRAGLKNTLDTHMKYKHSDVKPFGCDENGPTSVLIAPTTQPNKATSSPTSDTAIPISTNTSSTLNGAEKGSISPRMMQMVPWRPWLAV